MGLRRTTQPLFYAHPVEALEARDFYNPLRSWGTESKHTPRDKPRSERSHETR